jgi:hypothetical protein
MLSFKPTSLGQTPNILANSAVLLLFAKDNVLKIYFWACAKPV